MSMQRHIGNGKVTSVCFYHLRRLRQIRNYVSHTVMAQLVMSLVITRVDYCNSVLAGLPACKLAPLQRVQNAAARLVLNLDRRSRISPALQQLHWLPVKYRVTSKIATLMHQILHNRCPSYLVDLVAYNATEPHRRQLRSSTTRAAVVRRTRTEFGKHVFSVCGPDVWNSLPVAVRNIDNHPAFRRALKSHLFNCAFFLVTVSVHSTDFIMHSRPLYCCRTGHYNILLCGPPP